MGGNSEKKNPGNSTKTNKRSKMMRGARINIIGGCVMTSERNTK